jgi:hypothetical protein
MARAQRKSKTRAGTETPGTRKGSAVAKPRSSRKAAPKTTTRSRPPMSPAPARRMATSEARAEFSKLVNELAEQDRPSASLLDSAIEIGRHRKGGAWLVAEVDAHAAVQRINELEEELENIAIGFALRERRDRSSGATTPARDVIRELGFDDLLEGLPGELRS